MNDCTCKYCYHDVCFHPLRGEEASLGILCDGCKLDDMPVTDQASPTLAITTLL